jgi:hypothetical protein
MFRRAWRLWASALGQKVGRNDREADIVAVIRTCIALATLSSLICNGFIIAGVVQHWHDH